MKKLTIELLLDVNPRARNIVSVKPADTVQQAAQVMAQRQIGLVVVLDRGDLVGVLSERDIVQKWVCGKSFPSPILVSDIMTRSVEVASAQETIFDCYLRFVARNCRHMPVLDAFGKIMGVLSLRDVTAYVVGKLEEKANEQKD